MAFVMPSNMMSIVFQLLAILPPLIQQAELAFNGQPGSGQKKKDFVMASVSAMISTQDMLKKDLMTPEQEAAITETISTVTDAIVSAVRTAKLFQVHTVPKVA